jgi:hypothetical protein
MWRVDLLQKKGHNGMEITFEGQLTKGDIRKSLVMHHRPSKAVSIIRITLIIIVLLAYLVYFFLYSSKDLVEEFGIILPLLIIIYVLALPFILPYNTLPKHFKDPDFQSNVSGKITDQSVTINMLHAKSEIEWALYKKQKRSDDLMLLYLDKLTYNLFPRRFFNSDEDWKNFLELVNQKIPIV